MCMLSLCLYATNCIIIMYLFIYLMLLWTVCFMQIFFAAQNSVTVMLINSIKSMHINVPPRYCLHPAQAYMHGKKVPKASISCISINCILDKGKTEVQ